MIIELAGLPGSGKSTTAALLARELELQVITLNRFSRVFFGLLFILTHPWASYCLYRLLVQGSQKNGILQKELVHNAFFGACAARQRAVYGGGVIDQGLAHTLIAVLPKTTETVLPLIGILPFADLVLFCTSSERVRMQRLQTRGTRTRAFLGEEADRWERESPTAAAIVRSALAAGGVPVLDLATDTPVALPPIRSALTEKRSMRHALKLCGYYVAWLLSPFFFSRDGAAILMYHSVTQQRWKHAIVPALFERQMHFLATRRVPVTLEQIVAYAAGRVQLRKGSVAVTFDDGYADFMTEVLPVIQRYRIPVTLFLTTDLKEDTSPVSLPRITADDLRLLRDEPLVSVQSHGVTHRKYTELTSEGVETELEESARQIEEYVGKRPKYFAYPYGARAASVERLVQSSVYTAACAITEGYVYPGDDTVALKRIQVDRTVPFALFKLRLTHALTLHRAIVGWYRNVWRS